MYFQIIWDVLREPMRRALEALVMERQTQRKIEYPPFAQRIFEQGELQGQRDVLLRLLARHGLAISDEERARIDACTDAATLDRWIENVLGAKSASELFS